MTAKGSTTRTRAYRSGTLEPFVAGRMLYGSLTFTQPFGSDCSVSPGQLLCKRCMCPESVGRPRAPQVTSIDSRPIIHMRPRGSLSYLRRNMFCLCKCLAPASSKVAPSDLVRHRPQNPFHVPEPFSSRHHRGKLVLQGASHPQGPS